MKHIEYYKSASRKRIKMLTTWLQTNAESQDRTLWQSFAKALAREQETLAKLEAQNHNTNQLDLFTKN